MKIRLQLQTHSLSDPLSHHPTRLLGSPIYKGTLPTIRRIAYEEGLTALWKGNVPAELMYIAYGAIQFSTYRITNEFLHSTFGEKTLPATVESFVSGAVAGAVATTTTYPLDLLRTRFAAQGQERIYNGLRGAVTSIYQDEGGRGFFRGVGASVGQIVPYMGLFFLGYEAIRPHMSNLELPFGSGKAAAGMLASVMAKTGVFPLDLIRKRLQVQGPSRGRYVHRNIPEYNGVWRTFKSILKAEGVRGLYRGLTVSLFKAAPSSAVTMWTYERALGFMRDRERA